MVVYFHDGIYKNLRFFMWNHMAFIDICSDLYNVMHKTSVKHGIVQSFVLSSAGGL